MDLEEFKSSLTQQSPPTGSSQALQALWWSAKGDWDKAHHLAQGQDDQVGAWVHAYLHRVEGDESNAGYWYRRAGKPHSTLALSAEWEQMVGVLCETVS
jgi:hypothetical protein